ncbi:MAG: ATP-binding protein [Flavobacteriia bacterium]
MQIRTKLTFIYVAITASLLLGAFVMIFFMYRETRSNKFNTSLKNRALTTANLYFKINEIDSNLLHEINQNNKDLYDLEKISIFDTNNQLVFDSKKSIFPDAQTYFNNLKDNDSFIIEKNEIVILGFTYKNKSTTYNVLALARDTYGLRNYENLKKILTIVFFIISSLLAFTGWWFTKRIMRPISNIMNQVDDISPQNLSSRLESLKSEDELGRLVKTFNAMLARVENAFKIQKTFTSNAAHELKNPLTIITSQLEVSLLKERSIEEYKTICESILEDIKRLNETTNQLFLITKLSNAAFHNTNVRLRIDELIWDVRAEILHQDPKAKIDIDLSNLPDKDDLLYFELNETLMKTCLTNLILNGLKFSENNSILINLMFCSGKIKINFINDGLLVPVEDVPFLFEPFYRSRQSLAIKGFGVGLSIVQQITSLYEIEINYSKNEDALNQFQLVFP